MKTKVILFLLLGAVAASAAYLLLQRESVPAPVARITRDGVLLEEIDLDRVSEPYSFPLEDGNGRNTLSVEKGRIRIAESTCPGGDCVHTGWADRAGERIICLPNRLVISLSGEAILEFDAVSG